MIAAPTRQRIRAALIYALLALALILWRILPVQHDLFNELVRALAGLARLPLPEDPAGLRLLPGPELLVALTLAWMLRRPDQLPVLLIAAMALLDDLLVLRPIGLGALLLVLASEILRRRQPRWSDLSFVMEWLIVATVLVLMLMGQRLALMLTFVTQPTLGQDLLQLLATLACYPLVVLALRYGLGLRRPAPGEVDELGHSR